MHSHVTQIRPVRQLGPALKAPIRTNICLPNSVCRASPQDAVTGIFSRFFQKKPDSITKDRDRLLELLLGSDRKGASLQGIDEIVSTLATSNLRFDEAKLGGGPWLVLHTSGRPILWNTTYSIGKLANPENAASQNFNPSDRSAVNRAEYLGGDVWVSASGTYEELDDAKTCPKGIRANISSGLLYLWGLEVPLPIRGSGTFEVMYLDNELRVFRSGMSVAVQVKAAALKQLRERVVGL